MVLRQRTELHDILSSIPNVKEVYYSPPASIQLVYPCIIYDISGIPIRHGDNIPYLGCKRYTVTVIDDDPDSDIPNHLLEFPYCSFDRSFVSDGLNHFVFTIFF